MKKIVLAALMLAMMGSTAFAVTVDRSMPSSVGPSSAFTVSFSINPEGTLSGFDLADFAPSGWSLSDWSVANYAKSDVTYETQEKDYQGAKRNALHWKFGKDIASTITLTYTMAAPASTGAYEFIAVWIYSGGFNSKASTLSVAVQQAQPPTTGAACGNNVIEQGEECDGSELAGQTCLTKGFQSGTLSCSSCRFDTSKCSSAAPVAVPETGIDWLTVIGPVILIVVAVVYLYYRRPKKTAYSYEQK